jgi:hypothetical protein
MCLKYGVVELFKEKYMGSMPKYLKTHMKIIHNIIYLEKKNI